MGIGCVVSLSPGQTLPLFQSAVDSWEADSRNQEIRESSAVDHLMVCWGEGGKGGIMICLQEIMC